MSKNTTLASWTSDLKISWRLFQWILPLRNHVFNNSLNYFVVPFLGKTFSLQSPGNGAFKYASGNSGLAEALDYWVTGLPHNKQVFSLLNALRCFSQTNYTQIFLFNIVDMKIAG